MCSAISPEQRVPQDHLLRSLRVIADAALPELQAQFDKQYAKTRRPSLVWSVGSAAHLWPRDAGQMFRRLCYELSGFRLHALDRAGRQFVQRQLEDLYFGALASGMRSEICQKALAALRKRGDSRVCPMSAGLGAAAAQRPADGENR
jgi:hypothetical protein